MKLELKLTNDWLEATWYTEADEVKTQVHCESFSGHPEHIAMLRAKALEYGTELDEAIVKELSDSYTPPTQAELFKEYQVAFRGERNALLAQADILINKTVDMGGDATNLRAYRQALRDATITWVMPKLEDYK